MPGKRCTMKLCELESPTMIFTTYYWFIDEMLTFFCGRWPSGLSLKWWEQRLDSNKKVIYNNKASQPKRVNKTYLTEPPTSWAVASLICVNVCRLAPLYRARHILTSRISYLAHSLTSVHQNNIIFILDARHEHLFGTKNMEQITLEGLIHAYPLH